MKNKIKRGACCGIVIFNFFLLLGVTGACEADLISLGDYVKKCGILAACTIIPAVKSGLFR